jgi:hypothetical protein
VDLGQLNDVELLILRSWGEDYQTVLMSPSSFRQMVRRLAHHEAGHVAARMFTGLEASHLVELSIIANEEFLGHERQERPIAQALLAGYPRCTQWPIGLQILMGLLAGRGAAARVESPEERREILDPDNLWEEVEIEGTDLQRALEVAETIANRVWPARRVLALAERWTNEMLDEPEVWLTVTRLAGLLIERGTLNETEVMPACGKIMCASLRTGKWLRRLHL